MKKSRCLLWSLLLALGILLLGSASVAAATPKELQKPKNITAEGADYQSVKVTWSEVKGISGYHLYYSKTLNGYYRKAASIAGSGNTRVTVKGLAMNQYYFFKVQTYKGKEKSPFTEVVYSKTKETPAVMKSVTRSGINKAVLKWDPIPGVNSYHIYRKKTSTGTYEDIKTVSKTMQTYTDTNLAYSTTYRYAIRAVYKIDTTYYRGTISNSIAVNTSRPSTKYRALLIGEANYMDPDNDLNGPKEDTDVMTAILKQAKTPYNCVKRYNQTKGQILSLIANSFRNANDYDVSLFYYSGHGATDYDETYSGALFTVDEELLTMRELASALGKVPGKVIVILDSCGSGASITQRSASASLNPSLFQQDMMRAFKAADTEAKGAKYGELRQSKFVVICAASAHQYSYTDPVQDAPVGTWGGRLTVSITMGAGCTYPYGTYYNRMPADKNSDGTLTLAEIYRYVETLVSYYENRQTTMVYPSTTSTYPVLIRK